MIELLKDRYQIKRKIGSGGMAQIYLARDIQLDKDVAIKVLRPSESMDAVKQKRFSHEMRLLKKIESPYVVRYYDGKFASEKSYIIMEYVDGYILRDYISNRIRLTVDETIEFAKQLALGFDEIHKEGIIHRDIKSQNIMVADNGAIKIVDFGIAIDDESDSLTKTNTLIASPQYVAPELTDKLPATPQSDIYALGIIIYEMLAGQVPYKGKDTMDTIAKHKNAKFPRITQKQPNVPQSVENIILKATSKNPKDRYRNMHEMFLALKQSLKPEKINEPLWSPEIDKKKKSISQVINSKLMLLIIGGIAAAIIVTLIIVVAIVI